jgi:hypothetical protein
MIEVYDGVQDRAFGRTWFKRIRATMSLIPPIAERWGCHEKICDPKQQKGQVTSGSAPWRARNPVFGHIGKKKVSIVRHAPPLDPQAAQHPASRRQFQVEHALRSSLEFRGW